MRRLSSKRGAMKGDQQTTDASSRSPLPWLAAAVLLLIATIAARWPGVVMPDSVEQYRQALAGDYDDWHPPILARTWALLNHLQAGSGPFFLIQTILWWGGLGLLAAALGRQSRHKAAALVLLVGAAPLFLGWATVILKDAQMACCLVAATGVAAWWRIAQDPPRHGEVASRSDDGGGGGLGAASVGRPLHHHLRWRSPSPFRGGTWAALILLLIAYATLVRGNAVFATVPFALALFDWPGLKRWPARLAALLLLTALVLGASGPINRGVLGAERSHVERFPLFYDLVGIAHFAPLASLPGVTPAQWAASEKRGCYTPSFWDSYGNPGECDYVGNALEAEDDRHHDVMRLWIDAIVHHPVAYAHHRLVHLNSNLRFWVGPGETGAVPPLYSEGNAYGLGAPPVAAGRMLADSAGVTALTPLGWPFLWFALAAGLLWASARTGGGGQARLGRALALSTVCMSASFAMVSLASDLRYHLWSMVAAALALILLADAGALDRRRAMVASGVVLALIAIAAAGHAGLAPRIVQPQPILPSAPA